MAAYGEIPMAAVKLVELGDLVDQGEDAPGDL
jgi:hypothetical protein